MRLSKNIWNEIEVATIATDETTILEIKALIALHSDLMFDKVSRAIKAKKSGRKWAARSGFNVLVPNNSWYDASHDFMENVRSKRRPQQSTHTEAQYKQTKSPRCAVRTFQNSSTPSSLCKTLLNTGLKCFILFL